MASTIGTICGLSGLEHGCFEILQGNIVPVIHSVSGRPMIYAIGDANRFWAYGFEYAYTIIPNYLITGILAMLFRPLRRCLVGKVYPEESRLADLHPSLNLTISHGRGRGTIRTGDPCGTGSDFHQLSANHSIKILSHPDSPGDWKALGLVTRNIFFRVLSFCHHRCIRLFLRPVRSGGDQPDSVWNALSHDRLASPGYSLRLGS